MPRMTIATIDEHDPRKPGRGRAIDVPPFARGRAHGKGGAQIVQTRKASGANMVADRGLL